MTTNKQAQDLDGDPESVARNIALRKLANRAHTRHELQCALTAKEIPSEVASAVLDRLQEVGLIDDATFASDWVESRQKRRHLSVSALRRELKAKGVDSDQVDSAVSTLDLEDDYQTAHELAQRRIRSMTELAREVRYRRLAGVLARRGFSHGTVGRVLTEVLGEFD